MVISWRWRRCLRCFVLAAGHNPEDDEWTKWEQKPCINCARPLYICIRKRWSRRLFSYVRPLIAACDQYCRDAARAKQRRAELRQSHRCNHCRAEYQPKRNDSRYCSSACRQAAYRQRQAKAT